MLNSSLVESALTFIKRLLPAPLENTLKRFWHPGLAFFSALLGGFPARTMMVIGVTGTKGKSTVSDMLFHVFKHAGKKTALVSTIRFALPDGSSKPNLFKMTMPGRGFIQNFLAQAKRQGGEVAIVEVTSEGTRTARHRFLSLNGLVVTNIQKEHIESHGSFEKYVAAKGNIVTALETSSKKDRVLVVNADNEYTKTFLTCNVPTAVPFSKDELANLTADETAVSFSYEGTLFSVPIAGTFNAMNALATIKMAQHFGVPLETIREALETLPQVKGRVEPVEAGQDFRVIVDYAHTPDSLKALYSAFPNQRKICLLGNTGGGRDTWKRPEMAAIAENACSEVILANEDPYDEDPEKIIHEMAAGMKKAPTIILDRREAIRYALSQARAGDVVLISGKGTDPYIMEADGKRTPWSDASVAKEELVKLLGKDSVE